MTASSLNPTTDTNAWREPIREAERMLLKACDFSKLDRLFAGCGLWAVVGGAVRDSLLLSQAQRKERVSWPDLDVAFLGDLSLVKVVAENSSVCRTVLQNMFGGLKLELINGEAVDVWSWPHPDAAPVTEADWCLLLDRVDFGVNAAAYVGDSARIILHPRWCEDVARGRVEVLAAPAPDGITRERGARFLHCPVDETSTPIGVLVGGDRTIYLTRRDCDQAAFVVKPGRRG